MSHNLENEIARLKNILRSIVMKCDGSSTQSRRIQNIRERAQAGLEGRSWNTRTENLDSTVKDAIARATGMLVRRNAMLEEQLRISNEQIARLQAAANAQLTYESQPSFIRAVGRALRIS